MAITKNDIKKRLKQHGYTALTFDAKSLYIPMEYNKRSEVYERLTAIFVLEGAKYIKNKRTYTSDGHVQIGTTNLLITPQKILKADQRRLSRYLGRESRKSIKNEIYLEKAISQIIWDTMTPLTVVFVARTNRVTVKNVTGTKSVGADTKNRKKADILLVTKTGQKLPVSIKMDTASFWESADGYWGDNAKKLLVSAAMDGKLEAEVNGNSMRMKKAVGTTATRQEEKDVVFGSDVVRNGFILKRTFTDKDFKYDGKNHILTVTCSHIYKTQTDLKNDDKAWFVVRNNKNMKSKRIGVDGVTVDAVPKKSVTGVTVKIPRQKVK